MSLTPMDVDTPRPPAPSKAAVGLTRPAIGVPATAKVSDVIQTFRPTRGFRRYYHNEGTSILSLDFDDKGETLMTAETDESIQLYNILDGTFKKSLYSKKYGVKLAKFTHNSTAIIYASTKENNDIRYLSTHDNSFIRYFKGHTDSVTCLTMNPGDDTFLSCSSDDTLRIWDLKSPNAIGKLFLSQPHLAAFDPSANVFAVASPSAQTILLYDFRNFDKEPFAAFDTLQAANSVKPGSCNMNWTKLEFSNDGKSLLVGTAGHGHYVLDAFDGSLKQYLTRKAGGVRRLFAGEKQAEGIAESEKKLETSGDVCFSPDGRYVLSGQYKSNVLVYDIATPSQEKSMPPTHELELKTEASVIQYNPRFNMFATADRDLHLWAPDRDAL